MTEDGVTIFSPTWRTAVAAILIAVTSSCSEGGDDDDGQCPAGQPDDRSPCSPPGLSCDYHGGPCGGSGGEFYRAECGDDLLWVVTYWAEGCD